MHHLSYAGGRDPALKSIYCTKCRKVFRWRIDAQWAREMVYRYNTHDDRVAVVGDER